MSFTLVKGITFFLSLCLGTQALIAYDCSDKNAEISAVSIRDVAECPTVETTYKSEPVQIKVLQKDEIKLRHVWTCCVELTRIIMHCGMHSHSSIVTGGISNSIHRLGAEECRSIHRYRMLKLYHQEIGGINLNGTTSASLTIGGALNSDGTCKGTTYQENGQSWQDVVIVASVKIKVSDYEAKVKIEENEISLLGGIVCPFMKGYCFDTTAGEVTWDSEPLTTCEESLSLLYLGRAERISNQITTEQFLVIEDSTKVFALTLIKKIMICQLEIWQTEHPRILVIEGKQRDKITPKINILPHNADLMAYVNSKFFYVEQAYNRKLDQLYTDTVHRRCLIQREILKNRLLMAPLVPNTLSQLVREGGGYVGRVLGEVLYIMRCVPRTVEIRRSKKCYNELPILVNNQSKFMAPVTRIIQNYAEEIDCNGLMPPLYWIDEQWMGLSPYPTAQKSPEKLIPDSNSKLKFNPIQPIGALGIYTQDEIMNAQRILNFGIERKAVENIIARRVAGLETSDQGFSTIHMFDPAEMKELAHNTIRQIWGWFTDLGIFMSGLMGFYAIFRMIKYGLGVLLNGLHLYKLFGCGIMILASFWNTLSVFVTNRHHARQENLRNNQEPNEEILDSPPISTLYPSLAASAPHWTEGQNAGSATDRSLPV
ncbi:uncharacterized protein LOC123677619 [Harmonia axyridis]|uniref:uncharacterized protein LOC123677619 n=1 Tax=Harmonia axyridis TaxID=115357 RepID=UPI001E278CCB|nr:uncharacterized protein LOC123677619 [Harmonia axyridis]